MKLQEWREAAGMTKKQLADTIGRMANRDITASHIRAWEHGSMPSWDLGEAIATLTGGKVKPASFL